VDFLIPYGWTLERLRAAPGRGSSHGVARLAEGVSLDQAQSDLAGIAALLEQQFPQRNAGWSVALVPIHEQTVDQVRPALLVLAGAVLMVLLVSVVNVANLLLARSTVRAREMAIRAALGAGRLRLVGQMLLESVILGVTGSLGGLLLAFAFHRGLLALVASRIPVPRIDQVALDAPVLVSTVALGLLAGLAFGVVPALVASTGLGESLRDGGRHGPRRGPRRALDALVVAEVALSLALLTGAGLLIRSLLRLQSIDPGFRADGVLTARVQLPPVHYADGRRSSGFFSDALARIAVLPGVLDSAGVSFLPLTGPGIGTSFYRADRPVPAPGEAPTTEVRPVTPGFFRTMGIPHLGGRDFAVSDTTDSPAVAIVSQTLARGQFPGEEPLGRRLHVNVGASGGDTFEIVGIVGDIKMASLDADTRPAVYIPHTQLAVGLMTFVIRTPGEPLSLAPEVGAAVRAIDPELPLADVRAMSEVVDQTLARPRIVGVLVGVFALMALLLAAVGVYGVMAFSVAERTREIGVRMALGATPRSVFRLVLTRALRLSGLGVGAGIAGASALTRGLESLLYETAPLDPATFGATSLVLVAVAIAASYVPARRGTRIAPVEALRIE
jgi:predicted permease